MSATARTFIAVDVPESLELAEVRNALATMGRAVKPVKTDGLHLTLRFLGDVDRKETVPLFADLLDDAARDCSVFSMRIVGLNAFPRVERPSVVWAGLEGAEPLVRLAAELEAGLRSLGFSADPKGFHPHVTLARVRSRPPGELAELFAEHAATDFGTAPITELRLYESELRPEGAKYTPLHIAKLRNS